MILANLKHVHKNGYHSGQDCARAANLVSNQRARNRQSESGLGSLLARTVCWQWPFFWGWSEHAKATCAMFHDIDLSHENGYYSDHNGARALNFVSNRQARYRRPESVFGSSIARTARTQRPVFRGRSNRAKLTPARNHWFPWLFPLDHPMLLTHLRYDDGWPLTWKCITQGSKLGINLSCSSFHQRVPARGIDRCVKNPQKWKVFLTLLKNWMLQGIFLGMSIKGQ